MAWQRIGGKWLALAGLALTGLALTGLAVDGSPYLSEVMPGDATLLPDEDGDFPGWVELSNLGQTTVHLEGYGLTDEPLRPFKWTFPAVSLAPGAQLVVFTSGKDRRQLSREAEQGVGEPPALSPDAIPGLLAWYDAQDANSLTTVEGRVVRWADKSGREIVYSVPTPIFPDRVPGLQLWLDAAETSTVQVVDGLVVQWWDRSAQGSNARQVDVPAQPTYALDPVVGLPLLTFDGTNDFLVFPDQSEIRTVFWMGRESPQADQEPRPLLGDLTFYDLHRGDRGALLSGVPGVAGADSGASFWLDGQQVDPFTTVLPRRLALVSILSTNNLRANTLSSDRLLPGRFWWGEIAEVLVYNQELTEAQRRGVEQYLLAKWHPPLPPPPTRYDAAQDDPNRRPRLTRDLMTGLPQAHFDGETSYLSFPRISQIRSVVWVGREQAGQADGRRTLLGDTFYYDFHRGDDRLIYSRIWSTPGADVVAFLNGARVEPTQTRLSWGWSLLTTLTAANCSANLLGGDRLLDGYYWAGDIAEVLLYSRQLTPEERQGLERHLRAKWQLPSRHLHTNFRLPPTGQWLALTSPQGQTVDWAPPGPVRPELSLGRAPGARGPWLLYRTPTPAQANPATGYPAAAEEPVMRPESGCYTHEVAVTLDTSDPWAVLYYSVDGSEPEAPPTAPSDVGWVDDSLPEGASTEGPENDWEWVREDPQPFFGRLAHHSRLAQGMHQHFFTNATATVEPTAHDALYAYVYLAPGRVPQGIMLQWHTENSWMHRAYWGSNLFGLGTEGTASAYPMGPLPPAGRWARLEVAARNVELVGRTVNGMAFTLYDGEAFWDKAGITSMTNATRTYAGPMILRSNTVVRAVICRPGFLPSRAVSKTYLVHATSTVPIISLVSDPKHLFSQETGIYALGTNASPLPPFTGANFWKDWERPVQVEFFEPNGQLGFRQDAGLKMHGGWSRSAPQKSLRLHARRRYGATEFRYPLFAGTAVDHFATLILRNGGNDWVRTLFRDALSQSLAADLGLDHQANRPVHVYLNGRYWGLYRLQERLDADYLASHHAADPEQVDIIENDITIRAGDSARYDALLDFVGSHDLSQATNYLHVPLNLEVGNFIDYQATEVFADNTDWPGHNVQCWRPRTPDGRWRWQVLDMDGTFDIFHAGATNNTLIQATTTTPIRFGGELSTRLLRRTLDNPQFREQFVTRFADLLNTTFKADRVGQRIDAFQAELAPEIAQHIDRWGKVIAFGWPTFTNVAEWNQNVDVLRTFAAQRPAVVRQQMSDFFHLPGTAVLSLGASNAFGGQIQLNTLTLQEADLPWAGEYFQGVPVTVTALPRTGYRFAGWLESGQMAASLTFTLTGGFALTAVFERDPDFDDRSLRPAPLDLWLQDYRLTAFPANAPAQTYPPHMLFFQTTARDPGLAVEMDAEWTLPYDRSGRSRVRGLGDFGFSFINTSDPQPEAGAGFLGAALLALRTLGVHQIQVAWTGGTVVPNNRVYAVRLQYRVGFQGPFLDVLNAQGQPVEYVRSEVVGDFRRVGPVLLPAAAEDQPLVHLRWKYYYLPTAATGARAELRVDDIQVTGVRRTPAFISAQRLPGSRWAADIAGIAGRSMTLLTSTNLLDWRPLGVIIPEPDGHSRYETPVQPDHRATYYRLRIP